ncbi:MAG: MlaD family protein [Terrimicrobiaceae bacterium]
MSETSIESTDHGEVGRRRRLRVSWAWLFPVIAALAAGSLFWSNWKSQGPEIEIEFDSAPGIQAGKTQLIYRGVVTGTVSRVHLDKNLDTAVVGVRLKAFATGLAHEGTTFWIDQPVIGITQTSGIESLIQGNSIQARIGTGAPARHFVGSNVIPLTPLEEPSISIRLRAAKIPFLDRGSPVYFRGVPVGEVESKMLDSNKEPFLQIIIDKEFAHVVRSKARFWEVPAASAKFGAGMLKIDLAGLRALVLGGISFDYFGEPGENVDDGTEFELSENENAARACGAPVTISFKDGLGIRPGMTELRYLGMPVGLVESARTDPASRTAEATVRLESGYESLLNAGSTFTLVRPWVSFEGVSGLESLIAGVYIACTPGNGGPGETRFIGRTLSDAEGAQSGEIGTTVTLHARDIATIGKGAPVISRGIIVGRVKEKSFDAQNQPVLTVGIRQEFTHMLFKNSRFWRVPATSVKAGPGVINVDVAGIETLWQGGVMFDAFEAPEGQATNGSRFELFANERAARADSAPLQIEFTNGQGLLAGQTQLRYLGVPVGLVESVTASDGKVTATARLEPGYEFLRRKGSIFTVIRPSISMEGVTGLEALVSGVYIECLPGPKGPLAERFQGASAQVAAAIEAEESGFEVVVQTRSSTISAGAPVRYRGVPVGKIIRKTLSADGRDVLLTAAIDRPYAPLLRENTKFWDVSGVRASLGFFAIKVQTGSLESLTLGGIEFATPEGSAMGSRVKAGHVFELNAAPRREWLRWSPSIPVSGEN